MNTNTQALREAMDEELSLVLSDPESKLSPGARRGIEYVRAALSHPPAPEQASGERPAPMTREFCADFPGTAAGIINELAQQIDAATTTAEPAVEAVPSGIKVERSFRWDGDALHHVPQLLIEFDPVPMNSPNDAKGWADRDAMAAALSASPAAPEQASGEHPVTLTDVLQKRCYEWGVYWRSSDAHGVKLTTEQALELLRDALGVEVEIAATPTAEPAVEAVADGLLKRAVDLHEKSGMPWAEAEELALSEAGIEDRHIDELTGNTDHATICSLLSKEDVREFTRTILIYGQNLLSASPAAPESAKPDRTRMNYYKNDACTAPSADHPDCICWTAKPEQQAQAGCDYCNNPMFAGFKCDNCGRKTEQQAQAGEPEVVAAVDGDEASRRMIWSKDFAAFDLAVGCELITLQAHREAMAKLTASLNLLWQGRFTKKDAALKACVEAIESLQETYARFYYTKRHAAGDAAITQAQEAL